MLSRSSCLVAIATSFISTAVAQSFSQPVLPASSEQLVQYTVGQQVQIAWSSPWEYTTVDVYQGSPEIYYSLVNATSSQTTITWTAQNLGDVDLSTQTFFFRLSDGTDLSQIKDSGDFKVAEATVAAAATTTAASTTSSAPASSTSASSTSSVASSSTAAAATSPAVTAAAGAPAAIGATNATPELNYTSSYLGVGLGLGIPFLLALIAGVVLFIRNKRKAGQPSSSGLGERGASDVANPSVIGSGVAPAVTDAGKEHDAQNRDSLPIGPLPFEQMAERDRSILRSITREEPGLTALPSRSPV